MHLNFNGKLVSLGTDSASGRRYCASFCRNLLVDPPELPIDLQVTIRSGTGLPPVGDSENRQHGSDFIESARFLSLCAHQPAGIWCRVSFAKQGEATRILCYRSLSARRRLLELVRGREFRNQVWMSLVRQGVFLPAFALLLRERQWPTVHASAVGLDGRGFVLTGLNGCGKSGLAAYLIRERSCQYLADNYVLLDPVNFELHGVPEPLRVSKVERSLRERGFVTVGRAFGKSQILPGEMGRDQSAEIAGLARVSIGPRFQVTRLSSERFSNDWDAIHGYLRETPEYGWPQLFHQWTGGVCLGSLASSSRRRVCSGVPCYELQLPRAAEPEARFQQAADWVSSILKSQNNRREA